MYSYNGHFPLYNLQALSGLLCMNTNYIRRGEHLIQLLVHEMRRVWSDRLRIEARDQEVFDRLIQMELTFHYKAHPIG